MSDRIKRFKKRREILNQNKSKKSIGLIDQNEIDKLVNNDANQDKIKSLTYETDFNYSITAKEEEVDLLLSELKKSFEQEKLDQVFEQLQKDVIFSIATPFGLGKIISAYDKVGGNITTVHNANFGIYANDEETYNRKEYTQSKNSNGRQFENAGKNSVGSTFTISKMDDNQIVQDAYTGKWQKADTTSPDHIESLSQYHKNGGFMQSQQKKSDFATDENNLALTDRSINQSMRDFDKEEWMDKETIKKTKNKDRFEIDEDKLREQVYKAKDITEKHLPSNMDKVQYYLKKSTTTGLNEGLKMGSQQAFGLLLAEFFSISFVEIKDVFNNGLQGESLYQDLRVRLNRVQQTLMSKWKDIIKGFSGGFISGFLSNLITTIINMFVTTGKRLVRMIREGLFSLLKALKMMFFPPENMTYKEATHEAMKLIAAGGIIIAGVALEEIIEKMVLNIPFLTPFAGIVTSVIVGSLTAIAMTLVVYLIDKMDILGVTEKNCNKYLLDHLDKDIKNSLDHCRNIAEEIDYFLIDPLPEMS